MPPPIRPPGRSHPDPFITEARATSHAVAYRAHTRLAPPTPPPSSATAAAVVARTHNGTGTGDRPYAALAARVGPRCGTGPPPAAAVCGKADTGLWGGRPMPQQPHGRLLLLLARQVLLLPHACIPGRWRWRACTNKATCGHAHTAAGSAAAPRSLPDRNPSFSLQRKLVNEFRAQARELAPVLHARGRM